MARNELLCVFATQPLHFYFALRHCLTLRVAALDSALAVLDPITLQTLFQVYAATLHSAPFSAARLRIEALHAAAQQFARGWALLPLLMLVSSMLIFRVWPTTELCLLRYRLHFMLARMKHASGLCTTDAGKHEWAYQDMCSNLCMKETKKPKALQQISKFSASSGSACIGNARKSTAFASIAFTRLALSSTAFTSVAFASMI